MPLPKVSVIIPAFNSARFIKRTIQSVIDQTYPNVEIICVDDGSVDGTRREVVENFPSVVYHFQENRGVARARNIGITKSTGDYLAFLDSDDTWLPEKLAAQMQLVANNPNAKIIHTNIKISANGVIKDSIYPTEHQQGKMFENLLLQKGSVVCSTLLVKKECIDKVGAFDEELRTSEDVHLFLRLAYHYDFYFIDKPLMIKNHHDANLTNLDNAHFAAGTIVAIEKIEQLFPQYAREKSKVMRRALFQRARLKAAGCYSKGDYKNAMLLLLQAFKYDKTPRNLASLLKQAARYTVQIRS